MKDNFFIFLPACILTKGYLHTAIYDTQREIIEFVPNDLYDFVIDCNKKSLNFVFNKYSHEDTIIVKEYIDFLTQNEYAIIGSKHEAEQIDELSFTADNFGHITNCVCEYSDFIKSNIERIVSILDGKLFCSAFELISYNPLYINELEYFAEKFVNTTNIFHLECIICYHNDYTFENIKNLLAKNLLINRIIIHSSPFDKEEIINTHTVVVFSKETVDEKSLCGRISKNYFAVNLQHIAESQQYNTCLHKKLFIDKNGNIKNCPFSETVFGNILNDDVENIITTSSFTKYWNIKKDDVEVCKDCEFRYICTDCRIFIKDKNNIYSQPKHCHYNPYIAKWKNEDGYITVEEWLKNNK